jgi:N-formylglutamate amidohydrolase
MNAAPFTVHNADALAWPVLLSVPHAGRDYPAELVANLRVPAADLLRLEDRYADRLVQPAISAGFACLIAHSPRAWIDLNRAEDDIDLGMFTPFEPPLIANPSAKTRGGLGLVPRRLQGCGELWRHPWSGDDVRSRIAQVHRLFHEAVARTLAAMRERFGIAILLDVHSMPPIPPRALAARDVSTIPQIVVGDRFGRSAAAIFSELLLSHIRRERLDGALNNPYPGDFILSRHGQPQRGVHALQLEVDRSLYLDSALRDPGQGLVATAQLVQDIASLLADEAMGSAFAQAAE